MNFARRRSSVWKACCEGAVAYQMTRRRGWDKVSLYPRSW
jgi:hypothetical protein